MLPPPFNSVFKVTELAKRDTYAGLEEKTYSVMLPMKIETEYENGE